MEPVEYLKKISELLRAHPVPLVGILLVIMSVVGLNIPPVDIPPVTVTFFLLNTKIKIALFVIGLLLTIVGGFQTYTNLTAYSLGIKKMKLYRHEMTASYDMFHNNKAHKAKELKYMGTNLRGLFAPIDMSGPRYDFKKILTENIGLISMEVLLLNPNSPSGDRQQLAEVQDAQEKHKEGRQLSRDLHMSLNALGKIYSSLSDKHKTKLKVKVANEIFYVEFNMADDEMIATHYCCRGLGNVSPVYYLNNKKDGLFDRYLKDFNMIWNDAKYVQFDETGRYFIQDYSSHQ